MKGTENNKGRTKKVRVGGTEKIFKTKMVRNFKNKRQ